MPRRKFSQHNLTLRKDTWYFQAVRDRRRARFSLETTDLEEACAMRDEALAELENPTPGVTLAEFAPQYLAAVKTKLKQSTHAKQSRFLRPPNPKEPGDRGGLIYRELGHLRLDKIDQRALKTFWRHAVVEPGRKRCTGLSYLGVLSQLFVHAQLHDLVERNPTSGMRAVLSKMSTTSRERAEEMPQANPLSQAEEAALLAAGQAAYDAGAGETGRYHGCAAARAHVACVISLKAGLRLGEVHGLEWGDIRDGEIHVVRNIASGVYAEEITKSGQNRSVKIESQQLQPLLDDWAKRCGNPSGRARVLPRFHPGNFRADNFKPWAPGHVPKDLRSTFATRMFGRGVPVHFVSQQLGHASIQTTLDYYVGFIPADWADRAQGYVDGDG